MSTAVQHPLGDVGHGEHVVVGHGDRNVLKGGREGARPSAKSVEVQLHARALGRNLQNFVRLVRVCPPQHVLHRAGQPAFAKFSVQVVKQVQPARVGVREEHVDVVLVNEAHLARVLRPPAAQVLRRRQDRAAFVGRPFAEDQVKAGVREDQEDVVLHRDHEGEVGGPGAAASRSDVHAKLKHAEQLADQVEARHEGRRCEAERGVELDLSR